MVSISNNGGITSRSSGSVRFSSSGYSVGSSDSSSSSGGSSDR